MFVGSEEQVFSKGSAPFQATQVLLVFDDAIAAPAQCLERRSTEQLLKAQKGEIKQVMDLRPQVVQHLLSKLDALGMRLKDLQGKEAEELPASLQNQAVKDKKAKSSQGKRNTTTTAAGDETDSPYHRLDASSVSFLMSLIEELEPQALSGPNLRRMLVRGKACENKELMVRIVEVLTGCPFDLAFTGKLAKLKGLKEYMMGMYLRRGRRGRELSLPPAWERDGLYLLVGLTDSGLEVKHRFLQKSVVLNIEDLPSNNGLGDLRIHRNWSEQGAFVALPHEVDGSGIRIMLHAYFPNQESSLALQNGSHATASPPSKRPLALEDGKASLTADEVAENFVTPKKAKTDTSLSSPATTPPGDGSEGVSTTSARDIGDLFDEAVDKRESEVESYNEADMMPPAP